MRYGNDSYSCGKVRSRYEGLQWFRGNRDMMLRGMFSRESCSFSEPVPTQILPRDLLAIQTTKASIAGACNTAARHNQPQHKTIKQKRCRVESLATRIHTYTGYYYPLSHDSLPPLQPINYSKMATTTLFYRCGTDTVVHVCPQL